MTWTRHRISMYCRSRCKTAREYAYTPVVPRIAPKLPEHELLAGRNMTTQYANEHYIFTVWFLACVMWTYTWHIYISIMLHISHTRPSHTILKEAIKYSHWYSKRGAFPYTAYKSLTIQHIHTHVKLACISYTHIYVFAVNVMTFMQAYFYTFSITHAITFSIACMWMAIPSPLRAPAT
jgi:hypothetical protein